MKMRSRVATFAAMILMNLALHGQEKQPAVQPVAVTAAGRLRSKVIFGPPGFGETPHSDSKVRIFYVQLQTPLTPEQLHLSPGGGAEVRKSYSQVQLWCGDQFASCEKFLHTHVNRSILASGITAYALEANDFFPVTMTVGALDTK